MSKIIALALVVALATPLGGCLDSLPGAITGWAGNSTDDVLEKVEEGLDGGEAAAQARVDAYIALKECEQEGGPACQ
jgi:hypothetical protein